MHGSTLLAAFSASHKSLTQQRDRSLLKPSARSLTEAQPDSAALPLSALGGSSLYGVFSVSFRSQTVFANIIYNFLPFVKGFSKFFYFHRSLTKNSAFLNLIFHNKIMAE